MAEVQQAAGIAETSLLNFVVSDGRTLIASRCVFPEQDAAASLYYSEGAAFERSGMGRDGGLHSELVEPSDAAKRMDSGPTISKAPKNPASARDSSVIGNNILCRAASPHWMRQHISVSGAWMPYHLSP